jgi:hypothetical protein
MNSTANENNCSNIPKLKCSLHDGEWSEKVSHSLNDAANGEWKTFGWSDSSKCFNKSYIPTDVQHCLQGKWIYFHGDSSLRLLFGSIIELVGGKEVESDSRLPHYKSCVGSGCGKYFQGLGETLAERKADDHVHYFREYWNHDFQIRITFSFQTLLNVRHGALTSFITHSSKPDIMVLQGGSWDKYNVFTVNDSLRFLKDFLNDTIHVLGDTPIIWANLISCHKEFKDWAFDFNKRSKPIFDSLKIPVLDRGATTVQLPSNMLSLCEGWHATDKLCDLHRDLLLESLCNTF